jgi:hypothetical protein
MSKKSKELKAEMKKQIEKRIGLIVITIMIVLAIYLLFAGYSYIKETDKELSKGLPKDLSVINHNYTPISELNKSGAIYQWLLKDRCTLAKLNYEYQNHVKLNFTCPKF